MGPKVARDLRGDAGFATVTAVMLCAGLALVSVALLNLAFEGSKRANVEVEREVEQQALRSAVAETAADLINKPQSGLGRSVKRYGDLQVEVVASNELAKTNIYLASEQQLAAALTSLANVAPSDLAGKMVAARTVTGADKLPIGRFLARLDLTPKTRACLRERLTVHASSVDPFTGAPDAGRPKDGGIVNLRARILAGRPLDLTHESTVVITGDWQKPLLLVDERTFRSSDIEGCSNETT